MPTRRLAALFCFLPPAGSCGSRPACSPSDKRTSVFPLPKIFVYFNVDSGSGKIRGFIAQKNVKAKSVLESWIKPLRDLGVVGVSKRTGRWFGPHRVREDRHTNGSIEARSAGLRHRCTSYEHGRRGSDATGRNETGGSRNGLDAVSGKQRNGDDAAVYQALVSTLSRSVGIVFLQRAGI